MHKLRKLSPFRRHVGHQTDPLKKVNSTLRSAEEHVLASTHLRLLERDCTALVLQGAVDEKAVDEDPVIDLKGIAFEGPCFDQFHCVSLQGSSGHVQRTDLGRIQDLRA